MPDLLNLIMILVGFVGWSLSMASKPTVWKAVGFLASFVVGGLIV